MPSLTRCLILSVVIAVGCGDDDDTPGGDASMGADGGAPDAAGPTVEDLCGPGGLYLDLFTEFLACNPEFEVFVGEISDNQLLAACNGGIGAYVMDGTVLLGGQAAYDACAAYIAAADCDTLDINAPGPCDDLLSGTVATAGACEEDEQCAGDAYCDESGTTCGACADHKANGAACMASNECASGRCNFTTGLCAAPLALGGACTGDDDCEGGLVCDASSVCASNTPPPLGAACDIGPMGSNLINACRPVVSGRYCKPTGMGTAGTCQPFAALGAACTQLGMAGANNWCDFTAYENCPGGGMAQCQPAVIASLGQACGIPDAKCGAGLRCGDHDADGMTPNECYTPLAEGATCDPLGSLCDTFLTCDDTTMQCRYDYTGTCPVP